MKKNKIENKDIVVKSNILIDGRIRLTAQEQKIVLGMISKIKRTDPPDKEYRMHIPDFLFMLDTKRTAIYTEGKEIISKLMEKVIYLKTDTGLLIISFLSSAEFYEGKSYVDFKFDNKLMPYLFYLKERFTTYQIENIVQCRSVYSIKMYEILKSFEGIGERKISLSDLKHMLDIDKNQYKRFSNLKSRVLEPARKEIDKFTDISFSYEKIKSGRSIAGVHFFIGTHKQMPLKFSDPEDQDFIEIEKIEQEEKEIKQIINELPEEKLKRYQNEFFEEKIKKVKFLMKQYKKGGFENITIQKSFEPYVLERLEIEKARFDSLIPNPAKDDERRIVY